MISRRGALGLGAGLAIVPFVNWEAVEAAGPKTKRVAVVVRWCNKWRGMVGIKGEGRLFFGVMHLSGEEEDFQKYFRPYSRCELLELVPGGNLLGVYRNGIRLPFEPGERPDYSFYKEFDVDYTGIRGETADRLQNLALRRARDGESGRRHLEAMVAAFRGSVS